MPDTLGKPNGWSEWAKYVLKSIERLERNVTQLEIKEDINKEKLLLEITAIKQEIVRLQVKAGLWGAAAAMIPTSIALILSLLL